MLVKRRSWGVALLLIVAAVFHGSSSLVAVQAANSSFTCKTDDNCSGKGQCDEAKGTCVCEVGHQLLADCSLAANSTHHGNQTCRVPCQHEGICKRDHTCKCKDGYTGNLCETKVTTCTSSSLVKCEKGSECKMSTNPDINPPRAYCICPKDHELKEENFCKNLDEKAEYFISSGIPKSSAVDSSKKFSGGETFGILLGAVLALIAALFILVKCCCCKKKQTITEITKPSVETTDSATAPVV
jgi:EGF-like domain